MSHGKTHAATALLYSDAIKIVNTEQVERVRLMHDRFDEGSEFNFNYNVLLLVAAVLAGLGLVSNSGTTVIASMLVSPIMGPVVGMAYGGTIGDYKLIRKAITTELVSLFFCICIGGIIGACVLGAKREELADSSWPTAEMSSRGTMSSFLYALPVAFFSGLGVAVSLLDEQTNSLVGVAISASLLPPAVNAGVLWISWVIMTERGEDRTVKFGPCDAECGPENFIYMGTVSLFITIANVFLIIVSSMIMFRLKEKLPIKKKVFWNDLGVARKIYRGHAVMRPEAQLNLNVIPSLVPSSDTNDTKRGMTVIAEEPSSSEDDDDSRFFVKMNHTKNDEVESPV